MVSSASVASLTAIFGFVHGDERHVLDDAALMRRLPSIVFHVSG